MKYTTATILPVTADRGVRSDRREPAGHDDRRAGRRRTALMWNGSVKCGYGVVMVCPLFTGLLGLFGRRSVCSLPRIGAKDRGWVVGSRIDVVDRVATPEASLTRAPRRG